MREIVCGFRAECADRAVMARAAYAVSDAVGRMRARRRPPIPQRRGRIDKGRRRSVATVAAVCVRRARAACVKVHPALLSCAGIVILRSRGPIAARLRRL